jgi:hypothetical protein
MAVTMDPEDSADLAAQPVSVLAVVAVTMDREDSADLAAQPVSVSAASVCSVRLLDSAPAVSAPLVAGSLVGPTGSTLADSVAFPAELPGLVSSLDPAGWAELLGSADSSTCPAGWEELLGSADSSACPAGWVELLGLADSPDPALFPGSEASHRPCLGALPLRLCF